MGAETFQQIAAGIESYAIVIALIVGGIWTFTMYNAFRLREKAIYERDKAKYELDDIQIKLKKHVGMNVRLELKNLKVPNDDNYYIEINIHFENIANTYIKVNYSDEVLVVTELYIDERNRPFSRENYIGRPYSFNADGRMVYLNDAVIEPKSKYVDTAVFRLDNPGLYCCRFLTELDDKDWELVKQMDLQVGSKRRTWSAFAFIYID